MRHRVHLVLAAPVAAVLLLAGCAHSSAGPGVASAPRSGGSSASQPAGSGSGDPLAYSRCMRAHGISDFPDPNAAGGGYAIQNTPGSDLDPKNPQFQAAANACKSLAPQAPNPDKMRAANLKFSQCMRAHGVRDFPDPDSNGQINLDNPGSSDLAPDNPRFQAAQQACQKYAYGGGSQQPISGGQGSGD
jgi:hypothetical protein